jgi:hypothetical protein
MVGQAGQDTKGEEGREGISGWENQAGVFRKGEYGRRRQGEAGIRRKAG